MDDPSFPSFSESTRRWLRRRLLSWFDAEARPLPWRQSRAAYPIWVSEVMLQQTQVATVIAYFKRFLDRFPTLQALAAAEEQAVLRLWEGLGYYRRARDLHQAAQRLVREHGGAIPNDPRILADLPGFGRYTVNAVLSQAYERRLPILETNSRRLLCRLLGIRADPRQRAVEVGLWEAAGALLPRGRIGAFNQALMELGALVCTATAPRCGTCPLAQACRAHQLGLAAKIPPRAPTVAIEQVRELALVVRRADRVMLAQRGVQGRWANLWEFPRISAVPAESGTQLTRRVRAELGLSVRLGSELATIRHSVTRFRITLTCLEVGYLRGDFEAAAYRQARWVELAELGNLPGSRPQRRLAQLVQAPQPRSLF